MVAQFGAGFECRWSESGVPDLNQHTAKRWAFIHVDFLLHQWMLESPGEIFTNIDTCTLLPDSGLIGRVWGQCIDGLLHISRWFEWASKSRTAVKVRTTPQCLETDSNAQRRKWAGGCARTQMLPSFLHTRGIWLNKALDLFSYLFIFWVYIVLKLFLNWLRTWRDWEISHRCPDYRIH